MATLTPRGFVHGLGSISGERGVDVPIETLFFNHLAKTLKSETFTFRKTLLTHAVKAFGTTDLQLWYFKQFDSPYLSALHLDFLRDTLNYLATGERRYELTVWDSLLRRGTATTPAYIRKEDIELEYFGVSEAGKIRKAKNRLVKDNLKVWITRENGFNDLLYTLYILLGASR